MKKIVLISSLIVLIILSLWKLIGVINVCSLGLLVYALPPIIISINYKRWTKKHNFNTLIIHTPSYKTILPFILFAFLGLFRLFFSYDKIAKNLSVNEITFLSFGITMSFISNLLYSDKDSLHFNDHEIGFKSSYSTPYTWQDIKSFKTTSKYLSIHFKKNKKEVKIKLKNTPNEFLIIEQLRQNDCLSLN